MKLIALIGTDFHLNHLPQFLRHYTEIGVDHFLCGINGSKRLEALQILSDYSFTIVVDYQDKSYQHYVEHHWRDNFNTYKNNHVSEDEWCLYADLDEFHEYPDGIFESDCNAIRGRWIERISNPNGDLISFTPNDNLGEVFPYGTLDIFCGISYKIMATKGSHIKVGNGFHNVIEGNPNFHHTCLDVHHFRWDSTAKDKYFDRTYTRHYNLSNGKIPDLKGLFKVSPTFPR